MYAATQKDPDPSVVAVPDATTVLGSLLPGRPVTVHGTAELASKPVPRTWTVSPTWYEFWFCGFGSEQSPAVV